MLHKSFYLSEKTRVLSNEEWVDVSSVKGEINVTTCAVLPDGTPLLLNRGVKLEVLEISDNNQPSFTENSFILDKSYDYVDPNSLVLEGIDVHRGIKHFAGSLGNDVSLPRDQEGDRLLHHTNVLRVSDLKLVEASFYTITDRRINKIYKVNLYINRKLVIEEIGEEPYNLYLVVRIFGDYASLIKIDARK